MEDIAVMPAWLYVLWRRVWTRSLVSWDLELSGVNFIGVEGNSGLTADVRVLTG